MTKRLFILTASLLSLASAATLAVNAAEPDQQPNHCVCEHLIEPELIIEEIPDPEIGRPSFALPFTMLNTVAEANDNVFADDLESVADYIRKYLGMRESRIFTSTQQYSDYDCVVEVDYSSAVAEFSDILDDGNVDETEKTELNNWVSQTFHEIHSLVKKHTGVPTEGDYIDRHVNSVSLSTQNITIYPDGNIELTFFFQYKFYNTNSQEALMTDRIDEVLSEIITPCMTDYEKVRQVYNFICDNADYDLAHLDYCQTEGADELAHTAYAALFNKKCVCQGYANLFYRMVLELGIDCRYVAGEAAGGSHGWNIVKLGNKYYCVDATWDGQETYTTDNYFLIGSNDFYAEHLPYTTLPDDTPYTNYNVSSTAFDRSSPKYAHTPETVSDDNAHWQECSVCFTEVENSRTAHTDADQNGRCDITDCSAYVADELGVKLIGRSISLDGRIGVNYYFAIPESLENDEGAYVHFSMTDGTEREVLIDDGYPIEYNGINCKVFTFGAAAAQMADTITATPTASDGNSGKSYSFGVKQYADVLLATDNVTTELESLIKNMLNYGGYSQEVFNHNTDNKANEGLEPEFDLSNDNSLDSVFDDYEKTIDGSVPGLAINGSSALLKTGTALRHYFTLDAGKTFADYTITLDSPDGIEGIILRTGSNSTGKYIEIDNIPASRLDTEYTLTIESTTGEVLTIGYSVFAYCHDLLSTNPNAVYVNLTRAICRYFDSAVGYFG